jgi:uncharacterized protein with FMN-binding domain
LSNNLLAVASAAVLTVYTAGYARTRAAADRFDNDTNDRRPGGQSAEQTPARGAEMSAAPASSPTPGPTSGEVAGAAGPGAAPARDGGASAREPVATSAAPTTGAAVAAVAAPASAAVATSVAPEPMAAADKPAKPAEPVAAAPVMAPAPVAAPAPAPPPVMTPAPTALPNVAAVATNLQIADSAAATVQKDHGLRDGTFLGWGSSRHGDIQAAVEVRGGRIISATITQCQTRYPCSRIAVLPPEVVTRQSSQVDFVSRATDSTNAFYYAVVNALSQAK